MEKKTYFHTIRNPLTRAHPFLSGTYCISIIRIIILNSKAKSILLPKMLNYISHDFTNVNESL